jgi:hypothetical protein
MTEIHAPQRQEELAEYSCATNQLHKRTNSKQPYTEDKGVNGLYHKLGQLQKAN